MEKTTFTEFLNAINKAKNILIALPEDLTVDLTASALSLAAFLRGFEKTPYIATSGKLPKIAGFLPRIEDIKNSVFTGKSGALVINTKNNKLKELSYDIFENQVKIYLKSEPGVFAQEDVSFEIQNDFYDLIIILGCENLSVLGKLFEDAGDLFFQTPKVNLDFNAGNEYFAAVNIVDINATSVAEILTELFEATRKELVTEDIATCLLCGIISQTNSFQRPQTTPKVFLQAARLMDLGGHQQEIVRHLYKTRSLPYLRLWGRSLARLKLIQESKGVFSILLTTDFEKSGAGLENLPMLLRELIDNISGYKMLCLAGEHSNGKFSLQFAGHVQVDPSIVDQLLGQPIKIGVHGLMPYWTRQYELSDTTVVELENKLARLFASH